MKSNNTLFITGVTLVATLGGLLFGYDTAVISGTTSSLEKFFVEPKGLDEFDSNFWSGFIISSALLGCIIGGIAAGWISDQFGRKKALILSAVLFLISAIGSMYPEIGVGGFGAMGDGAMTLFIIYRIIGGVGVGIASMNSPLYISEIAPATIRGRLVSLNQLAIVFGMVVVYFVNYLIALQGDEAWLNTIGWRYMFGSEIVPATLFLIFLLFVPETPRWLVMNNREDDAIGVLGKLFSAEKGKDVLGDIKKSILSDEKGSLLAFGSLVIIVGVLLSAFQQFIGINSVLYYAPSIFKSMGMKMEASMITTILVGVVNFAFTIIAIFTVDRFGRKPLMLIGAIGMGVCMLVLGTSFYALAGPGLKLTCMIGYMAGFAMSWGPVTWVLLSEMYPNKIRSWAMSIAVAAQWICNWIVSQTFPMMKDSTYLKETFNNGFPYWVYGVMCIIAALIVWKLVPETKGKTLEEMEEVWGGEKQDRA